MNLRFEPTPLAAVSPWDVEAAAARATPPDPVLRQAFLASDAAAQRLELLFGAAGLCVTTGQQPGLFLGPLFTLYKALSTIALADALTERLDRPVAPVFWVAGEDHDFAEANHVHVMNLANDVEVIAIRERHPAAPLVPLYRELLGPEVRDALGRVAAATPESEFRAEVLDWAGRHYRADRDFATAFAGALAELLGPLGLVVLLPTHPAVKRAMAPLLVRAVDGAGPLDEGLVARARELKAAGGSAPVPVGDGATTVMIEGSLGRDRLVVEDGGLVTRRSRERWSLAELQRIGREEPHRLSPNVLLRPVIEAALLPTLAYVAGPGELAYLPQCAPLYEALSVTPQPVVPRWSGRVIEGRVAKVLDKFGIAAELLAREGQAEARLVQDEVPADAHEAIAALRRAVGSEYDRLQQAAVQIDPTLKQSVASARNAALAGVADVEKRLLTHLKKQNEILVQQVTKARASLFPLGRPQERVFSVLPYLVRYGREFVNLARDAVREWSAALESASRGA